MENIRLLFLIPLLFLSALRAVSVADDTTQLDEFRKFALQQMKQDKVPAMTIGFIRWGEGEDSVWVEGFGYSDLENQIAAKSESAYRLGSVSKPMTAVAVLQLAERGKINLDAEVQTYVPYFPKKKWPVTVRQLLGHLGGISHYKNYDVEGRIKEHKTTREAIAIFEKFDLVAEPGTKYAYSSYGYNLLGAVVEGASGMAFGQFMKQNVWEPIGMSNTRLDDPADLIPNRVRGYRILHGEVKNSEFVDISSRLGAGGTRSTAPDLLKFAKGLSEGKLLSAKSMDLIYSSMATKEGRLTDYSSGWGTRPANGHFMLRHSGSQQETATVLMCFPALKLAIACAINQEDTGATVFANRLYEVLMNERWNLSAYVTDKKNIYRAMDSVFASGVAYFEQNAKPLTMDPKEIKEAFKYFDRSLNDRSSSNVPTLIKDGNYPVTGRPYTKIGSYMAKILFAQFGQDHFKMYHASGTIPFFNDYLKVCKQKGKSDFACEFSDNFNQVVSRWNQSWTQTNSDEIRWFRINSDSNLDEIDTKLRKTFNSASAYPDFSRELGDLTWDSLLEGNNEKSLRAGEIGAVLYPESARHLAFFGISLVAVSDKNRGISYLKKAYQLDPESAAEPDWLSDFAEAMAESGKVNEAVRIMEAAIEIYPGNAQLLSDMGEAYIALNDRVKAAEYFQKALALDPKLERAKTMLEKLKPW